MVRVRVLDTIKWEGARHGPGSLLDIPDALYRRAMRVGRVELAGGESFSDVAIEGANTFFDAGLNEAQVEALIAAGYGNLEAAQAATDEELDAIDGIGPATVQKIREA